MKYVTIRMTWSQWRDNFSYAEREKIRNKGWHGIESEEGFSLKLPAGAVQEFGLAEYVREDNDAK